MQNDVNYPPSLDASGWKEDIWGHSPLVQATGLLPVSKFSSATFEVIDEKQGEYKGTKGDVKFSNNGSDSRDRSGSLVQGYKSCHMWQQALIDAMMNAAYAVYDMHYIFISCRLNSSYTIKFKQNYFNL